MLRLIGCNIYVYWLFIWDQTWLVGANFDLPVTLFRKKSLLIGKIEIIYSSSVKWGYMWKIRKSPDINENIICTHIPEKEKMENILFHDLDSDTACLFEVTRAACEKTVRMS